MLSQTSQLIFKCPSCALILYNSWLVFANKTFCSKQWCRVRTGLASASNHPQQYLFFLENLATCLSVELHFPLKALQGKEKI